MRISGLVVGALAACSVGLSARAREITYHGHQEQGGVVADYTFTSDGAFGVLNPADITAFSVDLISGDLHDHFTQDSSGISFENYALDFKPGQIDISPDRGAYANLYYKDNGRSFADVIHVESPETIDFQIGNNNGYYDIGRVHNEDVFATEVSSAPEPGTWALMFAGVAMLGAMLRLGRRREGATLVA